MRLTTEVKIPDAPFRLLPGASIVSVGSCFAEIITDKMSNNRFDVLQNPFGTLYNPITISQNICNSLTQKKWNEPELYFHNNRYYPMSHSSSFSDDHSLNCINRIQETDSLLRNHLHKSSLLIITLGTSWCYHLKEDDSIVGNCHKLPNKLFERKILSPQKIIDSLTQLIDLLSKECPNLQLLFTVSPVRHVRDNMIDNSRSKGALLYAMGELKAQFPNIYYFPSYEILIDELRDYRFYDESLVQPSRIAQEIIWEKLSASIFHKTTVEFLKEYQKIATALNHRINLKSDNTAFAQKSLNRLNQLQSKFKEIDFSKEYVYFTELLNEECDETPH